MDGPGTAAQGEIADPGEVSDAWYEQRFDEIVDGTLELAAAAGALLFVFFAGLNLVVFQAPASYALAIVGLATATVAGVLWWWARTRRLSSAQAQPAIMVGLGTILVHTLAAARVQATPEMTFWFALVALAGGILFLSWRWFAGLSAAVVAAWGIVVYAAPPDPGWMLHGPFVLLASIVLAAVTLGGRRRIYRDLMDRELRLRRVNRELDRSRQKAERAEQLQSRFIANVSHDVRTPATAIIGEVRNLQAEDIGEGERESLSTIEASARHLVRLIEDILDIAKAEAGELTIEDEPFRVERMLQESLDMVANQAQEKGLELESEIGDDVPLLVRADPHRIQQVLGNLLSNAVKFTPEGGVRLSASVETSEPLVLRFAVEDTGIGIAEESQADLFRPFSRIEPDPETEGTGLGLAICKRLVDAMGGEIEVESSPGDGSIFWFTLPAEPADRDEVDAAQEPIRLAGRRAWIVGTKGFPAPFLDRLGFQLETMGGIGFVEEALADDRRPSLIVLDVVTIQAPEDFLAERVRGWRSRGIPVLVAKGEGQILDELDQVPGPGAVLTSSTTETELREIVLESLREGRRVGPAAMTDPDLGDRHPLEILVVEDSPVNRRLLVQLLQGLGYEPDSVADGEQALERLETSSPDLVLLDLVLPGMNGTELARRIAASEDGPRLVAVTGHTDDETLQAARDAGIAEVLAKPTDLADVREEIEATPSREPAERPEADDD